MTRHQDDSVRGDPINTDDWLYRQLEDQYFGEQHHERSELMLLPPLLQNVRVFVDIGASLGQYTKLTNDLMSDGHIFAIEADPLRYERLKESCTKWAADSSNSVEPMHCVVANSSQPMTFYVTNALRSGGVFPFDPPGGTPSDWRAVEVPSRTLDELFVGGSRPIPDLVKMDIEGGEYRALLGGSGLLSLRQTQFLLEVHPWGDPVLKKTPSDIFRIFYRFGYDFRTVGNHWLFVPHRVAPLRLFRQKAVGIVLDHPTLKRAAKKSFLALRRVLAYFRFVEPRIP